MWLELIRSVLIRLLLTMALAASPSCRGVERAVDETADSDTDPDVACVDPPSLAQQIDLISRACSAEFVCRDLPGTDTDVAFLQDCMPRRTRALRACLRTESGVACLANLRRDRNCVSLDSDPCQRVFECEAR